MLSLFIFLSFFASAQDTSDMLLTHMNAPKLLENLKNQGLCRTPKAARVCRILPWLPSKDEGAIELDVNIYVFLKASSLDSTYPMNEWIKKIPEEKKYQYVSYILAMRSTVAETLSAHSIGGLYILILDGEGQNLKPKSVFLATANAISQQAFASEIGLEEELKKTLTEWIPPDDYDKSFQFKLIN